VISDPHLLPDDHHPLEEMAAGSYDGFFDPDGPLWKVSRESLVFLGGMRALLMQIAHPKWRRV